RGNFVRHFARQKIIARITATHLYQVRLSTEPGNTFGQDEFSQWHIDVFCKMRRKISIANCPGATTIKPQRVLSMHDLKIACKFWPRRDHSHLLTPVFKPV